MLGLGELGSRVHLSCYPCAVVSIYECVSASSSSALLRLNEAQLNSNLDDILLKRKKKIKGILTNSDLKSFFKCIFHSFNKYLDSTEISNKYLKFPSLFGLKDQDFV